MTALLLIAALSGCVPLSYRAGWVITAAGAGVAAIGAGIAYESEDNVSLLKGMTPGVVLMAIGLFFVLDHRPPPPEPAAERAARIEREMQPFSEQKAQQREAAWQLTKEAQAAARDGDCARVIEIEANVKVMDAELYDSTFITDVAIQRCVGSPVRAAD